MSNKTLDEVYEDWYSKNKIYEELLKEVQIISFPKVVNLIKRSFKEGYNLGFAEATEVLEGYVED